RDLETPRPGILTPGPPLGNANPPDGVAGPVLGKSRGDAGGTWIAPATPMAAATNPSPEPPDPADDPRPPGRRRARGPAGGLPDRSAGLRAVGARSARAGDVRRLDGGPGLLGGPRPGQGRGRRRPAAGRRRRPAGAGRGLPGVRGR